MPNAWLNHVRQLRKNNRNMSYKQLLKHAKNSYGGGPETETKSPMGQQSQGGTPPTGLGAVQNMIRSMTQGGSAVQADFSRSSLTRSATTLGGRRRRSRKTRRRRR
jgi:hypothetical protein